MIGCENERVTSTKACLQHAGVWQKHLKEKSKSTLSGIRRIIKRPGEVLPWQQRRNRTSQNQPHDEDHSEAELRRHYFSPNRFYCVETVCAPCGIVIGWTLFDRSESESKILNWLEELYPEEEDRPSYIAIDKACRVCLYSALLYGKITNFY